jgi:O-antigen/teichoic acid export membrane protein
MSRTRRLLSGLSIGYAGQIIGVALSFWLSPFLVRHLGRPELGKWLIATQVVQYLGLVDFGVVSLLPRELSLAAGRAAESGNRVELRTLVSRVMRIVLYQAPILAVVALLALVWAKGSVPDAAGPIALLLLLLVLVFPLRVFPATLQGLQDLGFAGITGLLSTIVGSALTIVLVLRGWGLYSLVLAWGATQGIIYGGAALRVAGRHRDVLPSVRVDLSWLEMRSLLGKALWIAVNQLLQVFIFGTDYLIIGSVVGAAAIVPYSFTGKLTTALDSYPKMMVMLAGPGLGELRGGGDRSRMLRASIAVTQAMTLASGYVVCLVLAANSAFVTRWVGADNYAGSGVMLAQLAAMFTRHLNMALASALLFFGYERRLTIVGVVDGIVTVVCSIVLTKVLGPMGAPLGSVVGVCLTSLPSNVLALASDMSIGRLRILGKLMPCVAFVGLAGLASLLLGLSFPRGGYPVVAGLCVAVSAAYVAFALLLCSRITLGEYVWPHLATLFTRLRSA